MSDKTVHIGTEDTPIAKGIESFALSIGHNTVKIYTTGYSIEGQIGVYVQGKAILEIYSSGTATNNVDFIEVAEGGKVDINYVTALGSFVPKSAFWPWIEMTGTDSEEEDFPTPNSVECEEGTNLDNKYVMTNTEGRFILESTAKGMYSLSSNVPDSEDSSVENGTVKVIAANGYKQVAGNRIYRLCYRRRK